MIQEDPDVGHGNLNLEIIGITRKIVSRLPIVASPFESADPVKPSRFMIQSVEFVLHLGKAAHVLYSISQDSLVDKPFLEGALRAWL